MTTTQQSVEFLILIQNITHFLEKSQQWFSSKVKHKNKMIFLKQILRAIC